MIVKKIESKLAYPFILNIHYAKRIPSISYAYGLFDGDELIGICTFGSPASPYLCKGLLGEEHKSKVIELNRLCLKYNRKNEASYLVSNSIKLLPKPKAIVSYADTKQNHLGVVYQATNFIFTGTTKPRTDMASVDGKHSRHSMNDPTKRVDRSAKHRYVYFHGNKYEKKEMLLNLKYKTLSYPKDENNA
jgi:hypothetical protein